MLGPASEQPPSRSHLTYLPMKPGSHRSQPSRFPFACQVVKPTATRRTTEAPVQPAAGRQPAASPSATGPAAERDPFKLGPHAILAYLERGDPLDLFGHVQRVARKQRWWIPVEAALPRVRAEVALRASRGRGGAPNPGSLAAFCEAGLRAWLADPNTCRLPAPVGRCPVLARLPLEARDAFFRVFLERSTPDQVARDLGVDLSTLGRRVRVVLDVLAPPPDRPNRFSTDPAGLSTGWTLPAAQPTRSYPHSA